jgi:hypothetical protein
MIPTHGKPPLSRTTHAAVAGWWLRRVLSVSLFVLAWPTLAPAGAQASPPERQAATPDARVVTMTYLKSVPGKLRQLERYVRANWFAMDELAVKRGLFVSYQWLDTGTDDGPWNAIVVVTYRDVQGFAGIEKAWREIRAAHRDVLIDGARQSDLGRVVESRDFFEREPFVTITPGHAHSGAASSTTLAPDESALRTVAGLYFEASATGNPELIRRAFLPSARIEGLQGERLVTWSFDEYSRFFRGTPAPGADKVERTITRVAQHGNSATVQVRLRFGPQQALDEQLAMLRIDGQWKITYKSYMSST